MELASGKVYEALREKGVSEIHHANSVITSCQFLRRRSLLSRGTIERQKLYQTAQSSDAADRGFGLWFDVFTDSVDIHARAGAINVYGPVLFVLDAAMIARAYTGKIWVTKLNPIKWTGKKNAERWFQSIDDLKQNFVVGRFDQMIVFRHSGGELPFGTFLKRILLDDPKLENAKMGIDYFSMAYGALKLSMTEGRLDVPIQKRECRANCTCVNQYARNSNRSSAMFVPKL